MRDILKSWTFFASLMSRPPSVLVTRNSPDHRELVKMFKKERDGAMVRRLNAIILMLEMEDAEQVAPLCRVDADTIRRWVKAFNEGGLPALRGKKTPDDDPP